MDDLERALRAVLDDPAQMQELRELAGAMGFSAPQPQSVSATAPKAAEPEPKPKPVQAVFQQQPLPEPAAAMLRQAGKMDKKQEALLLALKPFLRRERQEKIDRALPALCETWGVDCFDFAAVLDARHPYGDVCNYGPHPNGEGGRLVCEAFLASGLIR